MKYLKTAKLFYLSALILYFIENSYFGWNRTPQSREELVFDYLTVFLFWVGVAFYTRPIFKIYEKWIEKNDKQ